MKCVQKHFLQTKSRINERGKKHVNKIRKIVRLGILVYKKNVLKKGNATDYKWL